MRYPTLEQVDQASKYQLGYWIRFLPSPGMEYIGYQNFQEKLDEEVIVMNKILEKFNALGGWSLELSKQIGPTGKYFNF